MSEVVLLDDPEELLDEKQRQRDFDLSRNDSYDDNEADVWPGAQMPPQDDPK